MQFSFQKIIFDCFAFTLFHYVEVFFLKVDIVLKLNKLLDMTLKNVEKLKSQIVFKKSFYFI